MTANLALFYIDWENQAINAVECLPQLDPNDPNGPLGRCAESNIVRNAGESEVKGAELEMQWFPTDRQAYTLGYGYTDSELKEYVDKEFAILQCPGSISPEEDFDISGTGCFEREIAQGPSTEAAKEIINELGDRERQ